MVISIGNAMRKCRICKTNLGGMRSLRRCEEALPKLKEGDLQRA